MRVLVIGAGAVGGFLGARLGIAGHDVSLVSRKRFVEAVTGRGLVLTEPDGSERVARVSAFEDLEAAFTAVEPYDLALLTVKAYDTSHVVSELQRSAGVPPPIVTLQNGIGNEEMLADAFGPDRVVAAAIETPVSVPNPGFVQVHRPRFRAGVAAVGPNSPVSRTVEVLRAAGLAVAAYDDYRRLKWSKLLLNLPCNALCAIMDWSPAQVMAHPVTARLEARAWQEAFRVMKRLQIRPVTLAAYPLPLIAPLARILSPALLARGLAGTVSGGRGTKPPSLHMALSSGQRTEVDWLNGAVARAAEQLGASAPVNRAFTSVLTALTDGRASWEEWQGRPQQILSQVRE